MGVRYRAGRLLVAMVAGGVLATLGVPAVPASAQDVQALQWYLQALQIPAAHQISTGQGVVVAVLDTGVQNDHPDLAGQVLDGTNLGPDNLSRGHIDGKNHGTGVAGIIAGIGGTGHLLGIAPGAKILPVRLDIGLPGDNAPMGIRWAVDHGAKVINLSNGTEDATDQMVDAVRYALDHDVVVVAAAGNSSDGDTHVLSPASIPGVIAVGGTDRTGNIWSGSVHGPELTLVAPAADIETLSNHYADGRPGGYINVSGTSASTPMVSGAVALIRAKYPQLHVNDVINRLISTADDLGAPGRDPVYGYGRLNVVKALTADVPPVSANPLVPSPTPSSAAHSAGSRTPLLIAGAAAGLVLVVVVVVVAVGRSRRG